VFFFVFLIFFAISYQNKKAKNLVILIFSLFFYYKSSGLAVLLLLFTITQDYWIARGIGRTQTTKVQRKLLIYLSVITNLLVLAYFKYAFLFVDFLKLNPKSQIIAETHSESMLLRVLKGVRDGLIDPSLVQVIYVELQDVEGILSNCAKTLELSADNEYEIEMPLSFSDLRFRDLI
jgi:hypothetical protein